jgi:hypothetical protein
MLQIVFNQGKIMDKTIGGKISTSTEALQLESMEELMDLRPESLPQL